MEALRNIWDGWLQFGLSDTTRLVLLVIDVVITASVIYLIVRLFNTRRGILYLLTLLSALLLLGLTAFIALPGLHILSQALIIVLLVGLPLFFEEKWLSLFSDRSSMQLVTTPAFLHPAVIILLSFISALILVGLTNGPGVKTSELPQGIAVSAAGVKEGLSANFGSQKHISVIVSAPRSTWGKLRSEDFSAVVDMAGRSEGTHESAVLVTSKIPEAKVVRVKPERVTVTLEPVIRKTVAIEAEFSGKAGNDLVPDSPVIDPEKVEVTGPKSIVGDITTAVVAVKLDGATQEISRSFPLVALDSSGKKIEDVTFSPAEAKVSVKLVKAGKLKAVGLKPVVTGQPATGYWVKEVIVTPSTVTVTGAVDQLDRVNIIETEPISVSGLSADTQVQVGIVPPSGISLAEGSTKVTAKITLAEAETSKQITPEISYEGLAANLKVTKINPSTVSLIVAGSSQVLANVNSSSATLSLDLSAYKSAGSYSVPIKKSDFTLSDGITMISFLPSAVDVTVESK